ncbi:MAG: hypothetical protein QOH26_610 [Actinomycetota bacterium]|nr:hypothetical protein [Actinomycetota bacterium]
MPTPFSNTTQGAEADLGNLFRQLRDEGTRPRRMGNIWSEWPPYPNLAEEPGLKPGQCGFESHRGH